jgi:Nucleoside-diphosphate-sugar epimerases
MNQILENKDLSVFGDGTQTRAFSYIDDIAPYIANCVNIKNTKNQVFNIGSDKPCTVKELAIAVNLAMRANNTINYLTKREEVVHAIASHNKFKSVFNPTKNISLNTGLQKMASWVMQHGSKKSSNFDAIEIKEKLPASWK